MRFKLKADGGSVRLCGIMEPESLNSPDKLDILLEIRLSLIA